MNENQNQNEKKKIIDNIYYQKNKEKKKEQRRNRYKEQQQLARREMKKRVQKYSQVENYKVLMTLKDYSILTPEKKRKWLDFDWTLKDLAEVGVHNISEVMRLRELAEILITDYWKTAKKEEWKGKLWNSLDSKKQQQLIKFWAREKVREEMAINEGLEEISKKGEEREKEIEMDKFHEERGKVKCECWQCQESKLIEKEVKAKVKKEAADYDRQNKATEKEQCPDCGKWVKKLDEENGVCKSCLSN